MERAASTKPAAVLAVRREAELVLGLVVLLGRGVVAVAVRVPVAVPVLALLHGRDQLGEHAGERVDLVAAKLGARRELRRPLGEHALEAEHERVSHLPLARRRLVARLDLGPRVVERASARRAGCEDPFRILVGPEEGLAGPCFCAERVGSHG